MRGDTRWQGVRALVSLIALPLIAADPPAAHGPQTMQDSLALQRKSVDLQRQAVRKQMSFPGEGASSFFTVPWPSGPPLSPAPLSLASSDCDPLSDAQITPVIEAAAAREQVKPALVRAIIRQESGFRACAVSPKGAQGLMQLMPATAERFHVSDPFDPVQNVDAGTKFLKELLTRYSGDLKLALGAYNAGPARVDGIGEVPDLAETKDYVSNILNDLGKNGGSGGTPEPGPSGTT